MHVRRALALAVVVPLLLAGCTDEPEPTPQMPDPTSSSPSPTPTESETPEAESAEDFIRRWVEVGDEMQVTGETDEYDRMTPECEPCQSFVANVEEVYSAGGSAEFAGSKIVQIRRIGDAPPTFNLTKDLPETTIHRAGGKTETLPGGRTTIRVTLGKAKDRWVVTHFGIL
ncbi:hypothetical protein [Nocardioides sp.]|uniref:hypothetical protein n=1 Tax=Nocardioides sp. TaxID=35761 RepID=UPI00262B6FB8|nr:hypothetical protein [Nocardioides sp.]MCW2736376.1 hypothetical protein [Nocardioides sp.]